MNQELRTGTQGEFAQRHAALGRRISGQGARLVLRSTLVSTALVGSGCFGSDIEIERVPPEPGKSDATGQEPLRSPGPSPDTTKCGSGAATGLRPAGDLRVDGVYGYQGVEVPLGGSSGSGGRLDVDLVQGRDLLVRAFVSPTRGHWAISRERRAHLVLEGSGGQSTVFEDVRVLSTASERRDLESTFNFYVPGREFLDVQRFEVQLWEVGTCQGVEATAQNRFPSDGRARLSARATGPARVRIVPIRFDADGSGRLPDVTASHMAEFSSILTAVFPVSRVELSVRQPVGTRQTDLTDILNQLLQLRSLEDAPDDVSYYGLVNPAETMQRYCRSGCVAGVAAFGPSNGSGSVGVGVGYRGIADETFVHEVGHIYRLMHAPCGGASGADPDFPHRGATLGAWGYDARTGALIDPEAGSRDFMSYCDPAWVSDYNYQTLIDRLATLNGLHRSDRVVAMPPQRTLQDRLAAAASTSVLSLESTPFSTTRGGAFGFERETAAESSSDVDNAAEIQIYRTLRVDGSARARWGVPIRGRSAPGERTSAQLLDASGAVIGAIDVYRQELSEEQGALYFVPQPEPGWHSIALRNVAPQPFAAPEQVRPFDP